MPTSSDGFWIAPSGDTIPCHTTHINMVFDSPEKFRYTKKEIKDLYDKFKEPYGMEGKAREQILIDLIRQGWIRVRYIPTSDSFTAQLLKLNERNKNHLYSFASEALKGINGKKYSKFSEIRIIDLKGNAIDTYSLSDIANFKFKEGSIKIVKIADYKPSFFTKVLSVLYRQKKR